MSLRSRLIIGLVAVVIAGLVAADVTTYLVVRSFLFDRVDDQLQQVAAPAIARLTPPANQSGQPPSGGGPRPNDGGRGHEGGPPAVVPPGTYAEFRRPDG